MGARARVRQYVADTVSDLCSIELADLLSRSCIVPSSPNRDGPSQRSRKKRQPSRPAPSEAHDYHVLGLLDWIGTFTYRSDYRVLQADQPNSPWLHMDLV